MGLSNEERMMKVFSAAHELKTIARYNSSLDEELRGLIDRLPRRPAGRSVQFGLLDHGRRGLGAAPAL